MFGGVLINNGRACAELWQLDVTDMQWTQLECSGARLSPRHYHSAVLMICPEQQTSSSDASTVDDAADNDDKMEEPKITLVPKLHLFGGIGEY